MRIRDYLRCFFRSAFGMAGIFLSLAGGGFVVVALSAGIVLGLAASLVSFGIIFAAGLLTGLGSKAAFAESSREAKAKAEESLVAMSEGRRRLAALRLGDAGVAAARDLVVMEAGRFLDACRGPGSRGGTEVRDPASEAAIAEATEVVDAWLREADETAVERRFGTEDLHPFPKADERVIALLKDKARVIERGIEAVSGQPPAIDTIAIEEEGR